MRQSRRVGEAEAVALHGGHPGGSGKSPSTKGFPHGPVLRGRQSKDILFWCGSSSGCRLQRRRCRVQGAGCRVQGAGWVQGAGCVRCGQGGHRQRPGDGCAISLQEISIVRQKKESSVGRAVRGCGSGARCEGGAVGEASVKARYLHGVSARHRSWYEWIFLGLQGGGRAGAGGGRRWAGPTFRSARRRVLHVRARGKAPCQGRMLTCSGGGWVDRRA